MKRSELKVGDELYYARDRDWEDRDHAGRKAVVLATEPYRRLRPGFYNQDRQPWKAEPKGSGVLVEIDNGHSGYRDVVPLAHLKGPYGQVAAEVAKRAEAKWAREQAAQEKAAGRKAKRDAALARAKRAGVTASMVYATTAPEEFVMLQVEELHRLLDRLEGKSQLRHEGD